MDKSGSSKLKQFKKTDIEEMVKDGKTVVIVNGKVYDLTEFYEKHPGGPAIITEHNGKDATENFENANHPVVAKKEMEQYVIGEFVKSRLFTRLEEIADHNTANDLWLLIHNKVYDVSTFKHPGIFNCSRSPISLYHSCLTWFL